MWPARHRGRPRYRLWPARHRETRATEVTVASAIASAVLATVVWSQAPAASRTVVVLSDLHMGIGRVGDGAWHPYEDFRWAAEFSEFLGAMRNEGPTDLILNGDTFELWQSRETDCVHSAAALGCSEDEALVRLERVLAAHATEMKALGEFAATGLNRVGLVPGDHDAALLFPSVGTRAVKALGAPAGRVTLAVSGHWMSDDGRIYAEHGHQIGFSANRFNEWPGPFVRQGGRVYLERSAAEQMVQDFYNSHEARYPIVDNVAEEGLGVKYVLAADGASFSAEADRQVSQLLRYFVFKMAWQQFRMDLDGGDVEPPMWDLAKIRAQGPSFLVDSLPNDDLFKPVAMRGLNGLGSAMTGLTDEAIVAVCDYRAAVRRARRRMERILTQLSGVGPPVAECPRTPETRGPAFEYYWRSRDAMFRRHMVAAQKAMRTGGPIAVFVHGHTHLADRGFSLGTGDGPIIINAGAWQRTITPVQLDQMSDARGASDQNVLRSLQPEQLAPCYSFVQIAASPGARAPMLRYWRQNDKGSWETAAGCT